MSIDVLFNWMNERHSIYIKKEIDKRPPPWTRDPIMQEYKFTNVYRDLDRVSLDLKKRVLDRYVPWNRTAAHLLVSKVLMYRLFNWPGTYKLLKHLRNDWDEREAKEILHGAQARGEQICNCWKKCEHY